MRTPSLVLAFGLSLCAVAHAQSSGDEWGTLPAPTPPPPPPSKPATGTPTTGTGTPGSAPSDDSWSTLPAPAAKPTPTQGPRTAPSQPPAQPPASDDSWSTLPSGSKPASQAPATSSSTTEPERTPSTTRRSSGPGAAGSQKRAPLQPLPGDARAKPDASSSGAAASNATEASSAEPEEARVVSTQERYLPGTEAHSPSTWGHAIDDPKTTRQTTATFGGIGLLHASSPDLGPRGVLRFGVAGEYFVANNFPSSGAGNVRSAGTFAVSFVPLEFLEAYLGYAASANTNSSSSPNLIQALGDLTLGAKGAVRVGTSGLTAGLDLRLRSFSGVGSQDVSNAAFGFTPSLIAAYDVREQLRSVPLRLFLNLGVALDGTGNLVRKQTLTAAEEFALSVNRYNRFVLGAGLEVPLPGVSPFLEYGLEAPLGVPGGVITLPGGATVSGSAAGPSRFSLGFKVTAIKDLTLFAAADLGLQRTVVPGVPATPRFNGLFGASFAVDPFQKGETKLLETVRERKVGDQPAEPKTGKAAGVVVDAVTHKPIPGVMVALPGTGMPPVASEAESGRFLTYELPPGKVRLEAQRDGYKGAAQEVELVAGQTTQVELALESVAKKTRFLLAVTSKKKPVAAQVTVTSSSPTTGEKSQQVAIPDGATSPTQVDVTPGKHTVNVTAPGYLAQTREVQLSDGAEMNLAFDLTPEPKKKLVIVKENKIEISQQVHFAPTKSVILTDSYALLDQVVDAVVANNIKRLRVEGHTDNKGAKKANQVLSETRAKAVGDYLIKAGIDPSRIETAGFGDARPIAPNLTARGRELNRRVEFIILER